MYSKVKKLAKKVKSSFKTSPWLWALFGVLLLASFFRLWQLDSLPPGLHPDEAANGLDVFRILGGDLRVLYETNGPREALFFYLQTPFVWLFGNTILALRLAPALMGIAAILVTFRWVKEWFGRRTALFSALFFATGSWAVTLSRDGYRASLVPLFIALNCWLVTKMIQTKSWRWAVLSGLSFGLGLYTYFSYRFLVLAVIATAVFAFVNHREQFKSLLGPLGVMIGSLLISLIPLGIYALDHPENVISGRSSVAFTNPELNNGQPLKTLGETALKTALMFNVSGDNNYRHNLGGEPMLNVTVGILFVFGLLLALRRIKDIRYFALLSILGVMLIPEMATAEGIPHGLRAIGALPAIYILAGIGVEELIRRFKAVFPRNVVAGSAMIAVLSMALLLSLHYDYQRYFVAWANAPETYEAYSEDAVSIANYLNSHPREAKNYVVAAGYSNITISYLTRNKAEYTLVEPHSLGNLSINGPTRVIVAKSEDDKFQQYLASSGMQFQRTEVKSEARPNTVLFVIYESL